MPDESVNTSRVRDCLARVREGDRSALNELIQLASDRLTALTRRMLRDYPKVRRWSETDDVMQNALVRLCRALESVRPTTEREFYALATTQLRRELIDLARQYSGPQNAAANHESAAFAPGQTPQSPDLTHEPGALADWREFHEQVAALPEDEREVFNLVFYQGLTQEGAAEVLDISLRTLQRRWQAALLALHRVRNGEAPGT